MASYKTSLELGGAYKFDAALFRDLYSAAVAFLESELKITLNFADVHRLTATDIDDALNDQLLRTHVISEFSLDGANYLANPRRSFNLRARQDTFLATLSIEIEGSREQCTLLRNQIEDLLRPKKLWYSPLFPKNAAGGVALLLLSSLIALAVVFGVGLLFGLTLNDASKLTAASFSIMAPVLALLAWFRKILFPRLHLELGRSADVGSRAATVRNFVFGSVVLALMVGTAASLVANFLSK